MTAEQSASSPHDSLPTGRGRTIATLIVLLAFFMDILDSTIVNVAIPSIRDSLGASYSSIQWIIAGYSLAFALFLITGGRLGDIVGYKRMFLIGIAGFTVASALSGLASTTEMLVGSRILQGAMARLDVGGNDMVHGREGAARELDLAAAVAQQGEGLGRGDLVDQVQADEDLVLAGGKAADDVPVEDFFVEIFSHDRPVKIANGK